LSGSVTTAAVLTNTTRADGAAAFATATKIPGAAHVRIPDTRAFRLVEAGVSRTVHDGRDTREVPGRRAKHLPFRVASDGVDQRIDGRSVGRRFSEALEQALPGAIVIVGADQRLHTTSGRCQRQNHFAAE
jgi:hypothetical protein